ncbi:MAG: hydantoinase/carbamoylase family amidase [Rhodospirillales bacterium]|nr:hydantoinase/carbamoylase family amidase [Rhodospirillales bacterium]
MSDWRKQDLEAGGALARRAFLALEKETADPPGVTRKGYGKGEKFAFDLMIGEAQALGVEHRYDAGGNLFLTYPGEDRSRVIQIGSHIDTVPHGGNYDGAAGVIAGVAAMAVFHAAGKKPPFDLCVVITRAEESCWFPYSYIGSRMALGILDPDLLDSLTRSDTGRTLADHMASDGFDPDGVKRGESLIDKAKVVAHIEPHIEQAPVLIDADVPIGVVTGIRGSFRYRTGKCEGAYSHSGAMPRKYRQDAMAATAELIVRMDALWEEMLAADRDVTITFGEVATNAEQHGFSKVAGETHICLDVRSQDQSALDHVQAQYLAIAEEIGKRRNVKFDFGEISGSTPALMSENLIGLMKSAAEEADIPYKVMASGAGHDAAIFALQGVPTVMIFIRNQNGSHNPFEAMEMEDFDKAVEILANMLARPAEDWL